MTHFPSGTSGVSSKHGVHSECFGVSMLHVCQYPEPFLLWCLFFMDLPVTVIQSLQMLQKSFVESVVSVLLAVVRQVRSTVQKQ
jgi:hypothetical protein